MKFWKILFFNILILSSLITISSISWFSMWMGLEINMMAVIPLFSSATNMYSSESALKYFIVQTLGSIILLLSLIMMLMNLKFNFESNIYALSLNSALFTKIGAAPFHFWFPEVIEGLNWTSSLILLTWQKIAPMVIIIYSSKTTLFTLIVILTSMITGSIMSLNQLSIRKILAFSSINHIGWMLACISYNYTFWLTYFLIYVMISMNLVFLFKNFNIYYFNQLHSIMNNKTLKFTFMMNFLSLGGLPPLIGFLPKWIVIQSTMENSFFISVLMIFITLIMLYTYIRLIFNSLTIKTLEYKNFNYNPKILVYFNLINLNFIVLMPLTWFIL
uniref:NADH-ubiquinone oxidoreductase chain 2 n=1 Tax=Cucujoidea sp. 24 KM-2017 TaxID=2219361 RepID=A0A346RHV4_9CUCU|nr:NADH dehydrogenase subunit 2 [Cucujoidea sp. 24 KM-2017]